MESEKEDVIYMYRHTVCIKNRIDKVMELLYFCVYNISGITILHNNMRYADAAGCVFFVCFFVCCNTIRAS